MADALARELTTARAYEDRLLAERIDLLRTLEQLESENAQLTVLREQLEEAADTQANTERRLANTEGSLADAGRELADAELELERALRLRRVHEDTLASLSWRLTRPLRWGIALLRSLRPTRN